MKLSLELVGRGVEGKEQVSNIVEFGWRVEPGRRPTSSGSTRGWLEEVERGRGRICVQSRNAISVFYIYAGDERGEGWMQGFGIVVRLRGIQPLLPPLHI